jgi:hypothetical protein
MEGVARSAAAAVVATLSLLAFASAARADGPPVGGWSLGGVAFGQDRYVALPAGRGTLLERVAVRGGQPLRTRYLPLKLGVPMIATDGSAGGLSHDGSTLVLSRPRTSYPELTSTLYLVNTRTLSVDKTVRLKGDFSFDAISPDASTLYLIQLSPRNFTRYAVRAFEVASGRLWRQPVVDAREPDEVMRGYPVTRATSPDGRYAYTLYTGGTKPFVHALDTVRRTAACIDVPAIPETARMTLRLTGPRLTVLADGTPVSYVNTATRQVVKARTPDRQAEPPRSTGGGTMPAWPLLAAVAVAVLGAAAALRARRRRAGAAPS